MNVSEYIKIEKHIPMPEQRSERSSKYGFLEKLEVGDSFIIDDNTPGFTPKESLSSCYTYAQKLRSRGGEFKTFWVATRTLIGNTKRPKSVRIWRIA